MDRNTKRYSSYYEFIKSHISPKNDTSLVITNTSLKGGRYHIPEKEYNEFLKLYYKDIVSKNRDEYLTEKQLEKNVKSDDKLNNLYQSLKKINAKLWVIEDDKRQCEKDKDFGEKFIKLSRDVHFLNDDRAKIKLEINNHTGSTIKEIKEYTNY